MYKKRLVIYVGQEHIDQLKAEHERTGVTPTEQVRRLILPPVRKSADYSPAATLRKEA